MPPEIPAEPSSRAARRPNLLFLFGDEHRAHALGCVNPEVQSPVLATSQRSSGAFWRTAATTGPSATSTATRPCTKGTCDAPPRWAGVSAPW